MAKNKSIAQLVNCAITKLNIETGKPLEQKEEYESNINLTPEVEESADNPNLKKLKLSININSKEDWNYNIDLIVEGIFAFDENTTNKAANYYLYSVAPNQLYLFARTVVMSTTSACTYGSIDIPLVDITFPKELIDNISNSK